MRVSVASSSSGWGGWSIKKTYLLAFGQVKNWKRFILSILFTLTDIQLGWSRSWNEILRHVKDWKWHLLLLRGAGLMLEVGVSVSSERRLLGHLALECRSVSSTLKLLPIEG